MVFSNRLIWSHVSSRSKGCEAVPTVYFRLARCKGLNQPTTMIQLVIGVELQATCLPLLKHEMFNCWVFIYDWLEFSGLAPSVHSLRFEHLFINSHPWTMGRSKTTNRINIKRARCNRGCFQGIIKYGCWYWRS